MNNLDNAVDAMARLQAVQYLDTHSYVCEGKQLVGILLGAYKYKTCIADQIYYDVNNYFYVSLLERKDCNAV